MVLKLSRINQNHRIATLGLSRSLKDLRKREIDIITVLEAGQHVVMGEIGDLLFLLLDAGHIDLGKADGQCPRLLRRGSCGAEISCQRVPSGVST